jgi:hypothetical protein
VAIVTSGIPAITARTSVLERVDYLVAIRQIVDTLTTLIAFDVASGPR